MQNTMIDSYRELIPGITNIIKNLKTRRNEKISRINNVTNPSNTLISKEEEKYFTVNQKKYVYKVKSYFKDVVMQQAQSEMTKEKCDYYQIYFDFKQSIQNELECIGRTCARLAELSEGIAVRFLSNFANGLLNEPSKFVSELENLIIALAGDNVLSSISKRFQFNKDILNNEQKKIITVLKSVNLEISNQSSETRSEFKSLILKNSEFDIVAEWLGGQKILEPLFNTKELGFSSKNFHAKCDGKYPTIVFIESTTGKRFGGYANSPWNNSQNWINDEKNFIFSLDLKEKFLHKPGNQYSMRGSSNYGPWFGNGNDIIISNNCNTNHYSCCSPSTYDTRTKSAIDIAGSQNFTVKSYEVFLVK